MGSILSDFPSLPQDADPNRVARFTLIYGELTFLGLALPGTPANAITRAALLAHLQALAGQLIKDELTGNPETLDYAGTDAATALEINRAYTPPNGRRWPGSNLTGYRTIAGSTVLALVAETNPGGLNPAFGSAVFDGLAQLNGVIRFRLTTATVALQGVPRIVSLIAGANQLNLAGPLPAIPAVGDIFDIGQVHPTIILPPRLNQILRRLPCSPNTLTAADITAAKV
jgi:hypothetical protein